MSKKIFNKAKGIPGQHTMMPFDTRIVTVALQTNSTLFDHAIFRGFDDPKLNFFSLKRVGELINEAVG